MEGSVVRQRIGPKACHMVTCQKGQLGDMNKEVVCLYLFVLGYFLEFVGERTYRREMKIVTLWCASNFNVPRMPKAEKTSTAKKERQYTMSSIENMA